MGKYTAIDDPSAYFQTALYTGNAGFNTITNDGNSDLAPDFIWGKCRSTTKTHFLYDTTRGAEKRLESDNTGAEDSNTNGILNFYTDGFRTASGNTENDNGESYVAWQWKANGGTTSSNTDGNITSTVQVNSDANFSIVTYTGNFTATQTVGHGLGVRPDVVIIKNRSGANDWVVWTSELTSGNFMKLNATDAQSSSSRIYQDGFTTSTFGIGANNTVNKNSNNYVAYCFNNVQGYSKFGKYVGNGNNSGPYIHLGFRPAFIMTKKSDGTSGWFMQDIKRGIKNNDTNTPVLQANGSFSEATVGFTDYEIDFLSNGFKLRDDNTYVNASNQEYAYMAFAEHPFVTSTGIPTTAR